MLNFRIFQSLKNPLVATFNETRALTFRKYPLNQVWAFQIYQKNFWSHSSVFALVLRFFLPLKEPLATLIEIMNSLPEIM